MIRALSTATCFALGLSSALAADMPSLRGPIGPTAPATQAFYVGARGGFVQTRETSETVLLGPGVRIDANATYEGTIGYSGFVGYDFGSFMPGAGARIELELGAFRASVDRGFLNSTVPGLVSGTFPGSGSTSATYLLANYYVDFDFGFVRPYVGVGLGMGYASLEGHGLNGLRLIDDSAYNWAYQVGAGVSFDVTSNLALELGYRYLALRDLSMSSVNGVANRVDIGTHQALIGARLKF